MFLRKVEGYQYLESTTSWSLGAEQVEHRPVSLQPVRGRRRLSWNISMVSAESERWGISAVTITAILRDSHKKLTRGWPVMVGMVGRGPAGGMSNGRNSGIAANCAKPARTSGLDASDAAHSLMAGKSKVSLSPRPTDAASSVQKWSSIRRVMRILPPRQGPLVCIQTARASRSRGRGSPAFDSVRVIPTRTGRLSMMGTWSMPGEPLSPPRKNTKMRTTSGNC